MSAPDPAHLRDATRTVFASERTAALPLLPTLFTALVIAALSLACRPSSQNERHPLVAAEARGPGADDVRGAAGEFGSIPAVSATVAFGQQYPLVPIEPLTVADIAHRATPARAVAMARRGCGAGRCLDARRVEPIRTAGTPPSSRSEPTVPSPFGAEPERAADAVPSEALPFIPAAAAAAYGVRSLGRDAVALGSSVLDTLALPR